MSDKALINRFAMILSSSKLISLAKVLDTFSAMVFMLRQLFVTLE